MSVTKQCPSCGSQWPADAPYCGNCATSLHNVQVQSPALSASGVGAPLAAATRIDDEYITMFRAPQAPDSVAAAHLQRVDDTLLWAHVQRLTVVVWLRYLMALVCGFVGIYAVVTLVQLPDGSDWNAWHVLCMGAILASIYLCTGALGVQAQRDMLVQQLRSQSMQK